MAEGSDRTLPEPQGRRFRVDFGLVFVAALAIGSGIAVWLTKGPARFAELLWADTTMILSLMPKIFGGMVLAIGLTMALPRERTQRLVGPDSGVRGLAIAALAGALVPGGPTVTYPMVLGLMAAGADLGAGVALVSGWVLLGVNRILIWEMSLIPSWLVALRVILSLWVPVALGLAVRVWTQRR
jgi:uncharacterized membrane protein YraQ (UPF0718 family)